MLVNALDIAGGRLRKGQGGTSPPTLMTGLANYNGGNCILPHINE